MRGWAGLMCWRRRRVTVKKSKTRQFEKDDARYSDKLAIATEY